MYATTFVYFTAFLFKRVQLSALLVKAMQTHLSLSLANKRELVGQQVASRCPMTLRLLYNQS